MLWVKQNQEAFTLLRPRREHGILQQILPSEKWNMQENENQSYFLSFANWSLGRKDVWPWWSPEVFDILLMIHTQTSICRPTHKCSCLTSNCSIAKTLSQDIQEFLLLLTPPTRSQPWSTTTFPLLRWQLPCSLLSLSALWQPKRWEFQRLKEH